MTVPRKFEDERQVDLAEIDYWVKYLDTTRDEFLAAVSEVGDSAADVKAHLAAKAAVRR